MLVLVLVLAPAEVNVEVGELSNGPTNNDRRATDPVVLERVVVVFVTVAVDAPASALGVLGLGLGPGLGLRLRLLGLWPVPGVAVFGGTDPTAAVAAELLPNLDCRCCHHKRACMHRRSLVGGPALKIRW